MNLPPAPPPMIPAASPPAKKSNALKWVLIGCGGLAFFGILACGGCFLVGYLVIKAGIDQIKQEGVAWIKQNELLKKEIGTVTHVDSDFSYNTEKRGDKKQVFTIKVNVTGERGKGVVKFIFEDRPGRKGGRIYGIFIREDGKEVPLGELILEDHDEKGEVETPDK